MSADRPIQLPLTPAETRSRQITRVRQSPEYKKQLAFKAWWDETDMYLLFRSGAQIWINNQGAVMAREANLNVEDKVIEIDQIRIQKSFKEAFDTDRGRPFSSQDITNRLVSEARVVEGAVNLQPGWSISYSRWIIDTLGESWNLSSKRVSSLKATLSGVYQRELSGFR